MIDADNQPYLNSNQSIELCEKRNAWWYIQGMDVVRSLLYDFPIGMRSNPEQCHIPHHLLNFSPGPYPVDVNINLSFQNSYSPSIYEILPHFNYFSIVIWIAELIMLVLSEMKAFYKSPNDADLREKLLNIIAKKFEEIITKNSKHFNLLDYKENLKTEPSAYANASILFIIVTFNSFIMLYYKSVSIAYTDINCIKFADKYKLKMKATAKSLFNFIIKTMKLKNYPEPEIDLTQYYICSQFTADLLMCLIKLFTPITTIEDNNQVKFLLELLSEFSLYHPMSQLYSDWCTAQMKSNGKFICTNDIKTIHQKGVLKVFEKSLNKQYFC
jgi:hypothetical protein